ncbi:MAG: Cys-tRNA(Pro) deacylase [Desulfobacterium sp.]|jgi:Cys-tRNA(Pro)/Cys-tRNA(Cys) deacylase|nr:Cys-tRNA(Pro) deacylase [Desulfobacterium sp.]
MTPAIRNAKKAGINYRILEYSHDHRTTSYGEEASEKLGFPLNKVFKTLVVEVDLSFLAICVIPVCRLLDLKQAAKALGGKKAAMADRKKVERTTGYVLGGISPLGQKKKLKTLIDKSALEHDTILVSAGRRGLEIVLAPLDLAELTRAGFVEIAKSDP